MLCDAPGAPGVEDRIDRAGAVRLERRGESVRPACIQELCERSGPVIAEPAVRIGREDPGEVTALMEQVGCLIELGREERDGAIE